MSDYYDSPVQEVSTSKSRSGLVSYAKVFLYMFIGLAITAAISFGIGAIFAYDSSLGADATMLTNTYLGLMISSGILLFVLTFVINFVLLRGKHSILVPALIYVTLMGILLSSFTLFVDWRILGMAFGITSGVFLLMTLIAVFTKGNLSPLLMAGFGLFIGAGILALLNWIIHSNMIMWIVSFVVFAAMMFITIYDLWNIKKITERGEVSNNLALYCAFTLYVDFIYIFIRVVYFLILIFGRRN